MHTPSSGIVVLGPIDDVGRRCAERPVQTDLLAADSLTEPGSEQQVTQLDLRVVDRGRLLLGRRVRLLPRYLMVDGELLSPSTNPLADDHAIEVPVIPGVAEGLQAVDAGRLAVAGAGGCHLASHLDYLR